MCTHWECSLGQASGYVPPYCVYARTYCCYHCYYYYYHFHYFNLYAEHVPVSLCLSFLRSHHYCYRNHCRNRLIVTSDT